MFSKLSRGILQKICYPRHPFIGLFGKIMREPILNIAVNAARAAGNIIMRALDRLDTVHVSQKNPNDYVTDIDRLTEQEIVNIIRKAHPNHAILGEESGESAGKDYLWIIDPIDGTRNFIHGFPQFAVSIGISHKGRIEHGVIYDPVRQELFTASRGKGARLNDKRIRVSTHSQLEECLLATGYMHVHSSQHLKAHLSAIETLIPLCGDIRRPGAATLDLAYVACGRFDGFWELGLKIWDIAAGSLLIKEAGGLVCDIAGGDDYLTSGNIVAGNPKILKILLKHLKPHFVA